MCVCVYTYMHASYTEIKFFKKNFVYHEISLICSLQKARKLLFLQGTRTSATERRSGRGVYIKKCFCIKNIIILEILAYHIRYLTLK